MRESRTYGLGGGRAMKRTSLPLLRRKFITLLGGAAATWPLAARARSRTRETRRIGVLTGYAAGDPEGRTLVGAFRQGLRELGWIECSLGSRGAFLVSRIPKRRSLHARAAARGRYRAGSGQFQ